MPDRPHGYARYRLDGCRCYVCGYVRSTYDDNRNRAIAYGTWEPWVDAEPVRTHIATLQSCGMGLRTIAALAGVDRKRLHAIATGRPERGTGPQQKVRPALAKAVLAVEPTLGNLAPSTVVDATGSHRRLQALVQRGWPMARLAGRLDMTPQNFSTMMKEPRTLARRALTVRCLYDDLWRLDPREHGVDNQAYSRARNHAASHLAGPASRAGRAAAESSFPRRCPGAAGRGRRGGGAGLRVRRSGRRTGPPSRPGGQRRRWCRVRCRRRGRGASPGVGAGGCARA